MDKNIKTLTKVLEKLDWTISEISKTEFQIETWSPAGEDIVDDISYDGTIESIIESVKKIKDSFDVDEHVEIWIVGRGERGVPGTVRELVDDAEAIEKMYDDLYDAVCELIKE